MEDYVIADLAMEMQSFIAVSDELLEKARKSKVTLKNSSAFAKLVREWGRGYYDNDPEYVLQWIEAIINKEG